jgi:hypothetical protein
MRSVDIGIDAARILESRGPGRVHALFSRGVYLRVPGGLVVLASTSVPRGPLHLRVTDLPVVARHSRVAVAAGSLRIGDDACSLRLPSWSRRLPSPSSLARTRHEAREWLPALGPTLDVGPAGCAGLPDGAFAALRRGDLPSFAALVGGRGAGLTPVGDDILAGVLLMACAIGSESPTQSRTLWQCARRVPTNDIARGFLACASRGRCIEPAHDLLDGLADADRRAVRAAVDELARFGSSSGTALTYGIRTALLTLPTTGAWRIVNDTIG